jgi:hypothetical protein
MVESNTEFVPIEEADINPLTTKEGQLHLYIQGY